MTWKGSLEQYLDIRPEIIEYCNAGGYTNVREVFDRLKRDTYSPRYFKSRINSAVRGAALETEGQNAPAYGHLVLKDIYEYKQYKMRNENESKNENKTTGNR